MNVFAPCPDIQEILQNCYAKYFKIKSKCEGLEDDFIFYSEIEKKIEFIIRSPNFGLSRDFFYLLS